MLKRIVLCLLVGGLAILSASCTRNEPKGDPPDKGAPVVKEAPAPPAKADPREVTVHVDGMTKQLALI
jgi:hypothetical protein